MATNQLIHEKSPYLRQHAENPVEWLPWGEAAFQKAQREDKPIFLSIGYSTCHWCHVMAHESFEDAATAEVMNRYFVPIKLDREERPDVDRIYMLFVQATTGSGGWPMSVWLTPDLKPFYGGTYFPPNSKYGRPGFRDVLRHLAHAWQQDREKINESSRDVTKHLESLSIDAGSKNVPGEEVLTRQLFELGYPYLERSFDERNGGFGTAPKFPRPVTLNYLLRHYAITGNSDALDMVTETLRAMARGGMHDQLGGGFHRYSVDERWFVPHFEKMLYDQAQLAMSYVEAFQITRDAEFAAVARDIFDYVLRDMTDPGGGFYSAEDADSADPENPKLHGEGAFYIWRKSEIDQLLGPSARAFCQFFGVEAGGNVDNDPHGEFTGRNILYRAGREMPNNLDASLRILFDAREKRPRPHLDNKILTAWNALMISALARAADGLGEPRYLQAAQRAAEFLLNSMYEHASGRLLRRFCDGEAAVAGFADDYAFLAQAMTDLFEATGEAKYLSLACELMERGLARFEDEREGGFFSTPEGESDILLRLKEEYDGAEPSANSIATDVLLRLGRLTGSEPWQDRAERALRWFAPKLRSQPTVAPQMAVALGRFLAIPEQTIVRCEVLDEIVGTILREKRGKFAPFACVFALTDAAAGSLRPVAPFLGSLERRNSMILYECRNLVCDLPEVLAS